MKVMCAHCANEGQPALLREKEPLENPRVTHSICAEHRHRLAASAREMSSASRTPGEAEGMKELAQKLGGRVAA